MTERSVEVERLLEDVWNYVQHYKPSGCTFIVGKGYDCKCGLYEAMDNVRAALLREKARADGAVEAAKAAIAYDDAIQACANDPETMTSFCSAEGDDLDSLYADWITKARAALSQPSAKEET
jgi:hypothetical protein